MDKIEVIALVNAAQNDRAAAVTNWTDETKGKFDTLMGAMNKALEAQSQGWFDSIINGLSQRDSKSVANSIIRAIGPIVTKEG